MPITFINPEGRTNTADLTSEQVEMLSNLEGYKVLGQMIDPFTSDAPAVSSKLTIHTASAEIGCAACSA